MIYFALSDVSSWLFLDTWILSVFDNFCIANCKRCNQRKYNYDDDHNTHNLPRAGHETFILNSTTRFESVCWLTCVNLLKSSLDFYWESFGVLTAPSLLNQSWDKQFQNVNQISNNTFDQPLMLQFKMMSQIVLSDWRPVEFARVPTRN